MSIYVGLIGPNLFHTRSLLNWLCGPNRTPSLLGPTTRLYTKGAENSVNPMRTQVSCIDPGEFHFLRIFSQTMYKVRNLSSTTVIITNVEAVPLSIMNSQNHGLFNLK